MRIIMVENRVSLGISRAEEIYRDATRADVVHLVQQALDSGQIIPEIDVESSGRQDVVKGLVAQSLQHIAHNKACFRIAAVGAFYPLGHQGLPRTGDPSLLGTEITAQVSPPAA